jgi:hypothetical protein
MTDLRDDLDRALRAVTTGEAPVQRAMRDGRRLRNRRRLAVLASALAVAAVAAVSPSLARGTAAPALPATSHPATLLPSVTRTPPVDPVVTNQPPDPGAASGTVAQGLIGGHRWAVVLAGSDRTPQGQAYACYTAYVARTAGGQASGPDAHIYQDCASAADGLVVVPGTDPAGLAAILTSMGPDGTTEQVVLGAVAADVDYFALTFADGQQLKLVPVSWHGHRYVAWIVPADMTIARLTAHLGGPNSDNGQVTTAVPFQQADAAPQFGLWFTPGQAVPPRASGIIGYGTPGGPTWTASAYEGPWGTCFLPELGRASCVWSTRLAGTELLGVGGNPPAAAFGSAAPGVAYLRVSLSNGTTAQATPVSVGNEQLFALWPGVGVSATGWTAYDAAGRVLNAGATVSAAASAPLRAG